MITFTSQLSAVKRARMALVATIAAGAALLSGCGLFGQPSVSDAVSAVHGWADGPGPAAPVTCSKSIGGYDFACAAGTPAGARVYFVTFAGDQATVSGGWVRPNGF